MIDLQVRGHDRPLAVLRSVESGSLLFVGPDGVGRRRAARWLAARLNCLNPSTQSPCGRCESCLRFAHEHPDYREISARTATRTGRRNYRGEIVISQLVPREDADEEPLSRWLERRPAYRRRVGVIDGADRLNQYAANSFLKMLEEPPSWAVVVLVAPSTQAVLPTLVSRCTVVRFGAVDTGDLGFPGHPAHRLGRPGPLLDPPAQTDEALATVRSFVDALGGDLESAMAAADELAKLWSQAQEGIDVSELLREELRDLPEEVRVRADDLVLATFDAIASFSPAQLAVRVLLLELRALLP